MKEKYIIFDFDGTIADSSEGVFNCVRYALKKMGRKELDSNTLRTFIGPPLTESFARECGMNREECDQAVAFYRELYSVEGVMQCRLYDGIKDMLIALNEKGFILAVATSKPEPYAVRILKNFGIDGEFAVIAGAEFAGDRTDKPAVLKYALEHLNIPACDAIMIGDRHHDVDGAHLFGMRCIGVLWGFGSMDEFTDCGADIICADVNALTETLCTM